MGGGFFRGTSLGQDFRYTNKEKKMIKKIGENAPPEFGLKVDMKKVKKEIIEQWIAEKINEIMEFDDEVLVNMVSAMLDEEVSKTWFVYFPARWFNCTLQKLDPREMQLNLTGFLGKKSPEFVKELWNLLLSAQSNPTGIPSRLLEEKRAEMMKHKASIVCLFAPTGDTDVPLYSAGRSEGSC